MKYKVHKLPSGLEELGYIYIVARQGRDQTLNSRDVDTYQHIMDNIKILIDRYTEI